jgi:hypothetical protein
MSLINTLVEMHAFLEQSRIEDLAVELPKVTPPSISFSLKTGINKGDLFDETR